MFAIAFPSLLDLTEKKRDAVNGGWHVEMAASAAAHPVERAKIAALVEEMEIVANDGDYAWKVLNAPSVALPTVVVVGFAIVGGF